MFGLVEKIAFARRRESLRQDASPADTDFHDAFTLPGGAMGVVVGRVSGHGPDALARATYVRYTLRAHLEGGLQPREALKVASRSLRANLDDGFAAATLAVHDPMGSRFTYASAGYTPPVVVGGREPFEPVTECAAPPLGIADPPGFRQSTFTLTAGARARLSTNVEVAAPVDAPADGPRIEELEIHDEHQVGDAVERFLRACGVALADVPGVLREAGEAARRGGSVTVRVRMNDFRPGADVLPGNVVRIAERRRAVR